MASCILADFKINGRRQFKKFTNSRWAADRPRMQMSVLINDYFQRWERADDSSNGKYYLERHVADQLANQI